MFTMGEKLSKLLYRKSQLLVVDINPKKGGKMKSLFLFFSSLSLTLISCQSHEKASHPSEEKVAEQQSESEQDRQVTQSIRRHLIEDESLSLEAKNVTVVTVDGRVELNGAVPSESEKQKVQKIASSVNGAKEVENHLKVTKIGE